MIGDFFPRFLTLRWAICRPYRGSFDFRKIYLYRYILKSGRMLSGECERIVYLECHEIWPYQDSYSSICTRLLYHTLSRNRFMIILETFLNDLQYRCQVLFWYFHRKVHLLCIFTSDISIKFFFNLSIHHVYSNVGVWETKISEH